MCIDQLCKLYITVNNGASLSAPMVYMTSWGHILHWAMLICIICMAIYGHMWPYTHPFNSHNCHAMHLLASLLSIFGQLQIPAIIWGPCLNEIILLTNSWPFLNHPSRPNSTIHCFTSLSLIVIFPCPKNIQYMSIPILLIPWQFNSVSIALFLIWGCLNQLVHDIVPIRNATDWAYTTLYHIFRYKFDTTNPLFGVYVIPVYFIMYLYEESNLRSVKNTQQIHQLSSHALSCDA